MIGGHRLGAMLRPVKVATSLQIMGDGRRNSRLDEINYRDMMIAEAEMQDLWTKKRMFRQVSGQRWMTGRQGNQAKAARPLVII